MEPQSEPRLILLSTTHRVAAGLLSWPAWNTLHSATTIRTADPTHPLLPALHEAGLTVKTGPRTGPELLAEAARSHTLVWLLAPDGDPALTAALAHATLNSPSLPGASPLPTVEALPASYDLPGSRLLDAVAVMDRLRSPGGCPWDAQQTHTSLVTYLIEESYELVEAIEDGDHAALREELGDVLFQVLFHARLAQEAADAEPDDTDAEPFNIDDVAGDLVTKLTNRHPHVFGDVHADTPEQVVQNWHQLKAQEKQRDSATDGVPLAQPALSLAAKLISRAEKADVAVPVTAPATPPTTDDTALGDHLLAIVAASREHGLDAEAALRSAARRYRERVRSHELDLRRQDANPRATPGH